MSRGQGIGLTRGMKRMSSTNKQSGAVSLFVVIFATLLITVITVSFLRLMINDQSQASNNDLSQSAYDSAKAGVEDAKRTLLRYQKICSEQGKDACKALASSINQAACNAALRIGDVVSAADVNGIDTSVATGEVLVQQTTGDRALDQAYTCVTIQLLTDDYIGSVGVGQSKLVPLIGKNKDETTDFNSVTIEWFSTEDMSQAASGSYVVSLPSASDGQPLLDQASWPANRPSVLRTQLMQFGVGTSTITDFDTTVDSAGTTQSNANTVFLYPTSAGSVSSRSFTGSDQRKATAEGDAPADQRNDTPLPVNCVGNLASGGYACTTTLTLPEPVGGGDRVAFLRVTPYYNASHFRITLAKNGTTTQFDSVQPIIDSTGRANTLFRRVADRVDLVDTSFPYPDGAIDLTGNLCKDFGVTDSTYIPGSCTP